MLRRRSVIATTAQCHQIEFNYSVVSMRSGGRTTRRLSIRRIDPLPPLSWIVYGGPGARRRGGIDRPVRQIPRLKTALHLSGRVLDGFVVLIKPNRCYAADKLCIAFAQPRSTPKARLTNNSTTACACSPPPPAWLPPSRLFLRLTFRVTARPDHISSLVAQLTPLRPRRCTRLAL